MDHPTHTALMSDELTEPTLIGAVVYGTDDVKIGTVSHVHGTGSSALVIVDVGGFLGIGAKPVAMTLSQLSFVRADDSAVYAKTTWTKEQVKALPEHHH
jgi:hypothetical protein